MTTAAFQREIERALGEPTAADQMSAPPGSTLARRFRHNAPLVSQLLAVRMDLPQTRARRRAGSEEGVAAYGATEETLAVGRRPPGATWAA